MELPIAIGVSIIETILLNWDIKFKNKWKREEKET